VVGTHRQQEALRVAHPPESGPDKYLVGRSQGWFRSLDSYADQQEKHTAESVAGLHMRRPSAAENTPPSSFPVGIAVHPRGLSGRPSGRGSRNPVPPSYSDQRDRLPDCHTAGRNLDLLVPGRTSPLRPFEEKHTALWGDRLEGRPRMRVLREPFLPQGILKGRP
jgi:hypothetical protein